MSNLDEHTKSLLERFKVEKRIDKPKFIPYNENRENIKDGKVETDVVHYSPFTDFMYNSKLPEVYRSYDKPIGNPLYRFLQSMFEGGFAPLVNKFAYDEEANPSDTEKENIGGIENLLELIDPEKCPDKFLPFYCRSLGLEWFPDLATTEKGKKNHDYYNRTFLSNIGEIIRRRGTESCVKYVAKVLTGMNVDLRYNRVFNADCTTKSRILWVDILAEKPEDIANVGINSNVIRRYINSQIPFYITLAVNYNLHNSTKIQPYHACYVKTVYTKKVSCSQEIDTLTHVGTQRMTAYKTISNIRQEIRAKS